MFSRLVRFTALAVLIAFPALASAADTQPNAPSVLVRVQSVNDLIKTVEYVGTLLPEDAREQVKQGVDFVKSLIDDKKGIEGLDVKGPIGLYAILTPEVTSSPVVGLIPVADEETVLAALKARAMLEVKKGKDGVYETTPPNSPVTVFFRFANGYAYITANDAENIALKGLPKPDAILGGKSEHLASATVRIDRLPEQMKKMALGFVENMLAEGKGKELPNETKALKAFKDQAIDEVTRTLQSLLNDGEQLAIRLNVNPAAEEFAMELEIGGTKASKLAKDIASIKENKSVVAGAIGLPDSAMSFNLSVSLAQNLKKLFGPVVDDVLEMAKKQGNVPGEIQTKAEPLIKALTPTLKAGDLDLGVALIGPDKDDKYTAIFGLKLSEGKKVEQAVKDLVQKELPPEFSGFFALDAEKLDGGAMLHTIRVNNLLDEKAQKVFGKSDAQLTFRDDLLILAIGPQSKELIKTAAASKPADVGVMQFKIAMSRAVPLAAENGGELKAAKEAAQKVFGGKASTADTMTVSIMGGEALTIKFAIKGKAIQFLAAAAEAQKKD